MPKRSYLLSDKSSSSEISPRPSGNFIGAITLTHDSVLIASNGLNLSTDHGASWQIFTSADGIFKGAIEAVGFHKNILYLTTLYDTSVSPGATYGGGGGITFSTNFGSSWIHIAQPQDTSTTRGPVIRTQDDGSLKTLNLVRDVVIRNTGMLTDSIYTVAVKTTLDNVSFDIAATDSSIWLPCFGGVLRVAKINSDGSIGYFSQAVLPPDSLDEMRLDRDYDFVVDPVEHYNHRAFSVIASSDGIWVGTAGGINYTTDGGLSWRKFTKQNSGISGNFVVALGEQVYSENTTTFHNIWAGTNRAVSNDENNGLSVTSDSGKSWRVALQGPFINNVAFDGKIVYAATDKGLYRSKNLGLTWEKFLVIVDKITGDRTYSAEFTAVGVDTANHVLYVGNQDGLAISDDDGASWHLARAYKDPGQGGTPKSYAYPNPFSPGVAPSIVRFQFDQTGLNSSTDRVTVKIFDFAMDLVAVIAKDEPVANVFSWTGINGKGNRVANGTYVYTIEAGKKKFWGKVTVRN